ncbi:MAG TPA: hypothetical protein VLA58_03905 [Chitinophagaceae bacterium]|nr:hypothetical protein [Chitinophagaceae bacterium]
METIPLEKGLVHLMEDRIIVENDDVRTRMRNNVLLNLFFVTLLLVYSYMSYREYHENPHGYSIPRLVFRILIFLFAILPGIVNNVIRFSTTDEIPYTSIKKQEVQVKLFNWNGGIRLYLLNNKIRTLWLNKEEMKKFRFLLDQKLSGYSAGV